MSTFLFDTLSLEIGEIIFSSVNFVNIPLLPEFNRFIESRIKKYYTSSNQVDVESCKRAIVEIENKVDKYGRISVFDYKDTWSFISKHKLDKYLVLMIHQENIHLREMIPWIVKERNEFFMDMFLKNDENEFWQNGIMKMKKNERGKYCDEEWIECIWHLGHFDLIKKYGFSEEAISHILNCYTFYRSGCEDGKIQWIENNSEMINWKKMFRFNEKLLRLDYNVDFAHRLLQKGLIYKPDILRAKILTQCIDDKQWKMAVYIIYNLWELVRKREKNNIVIKAVINNRVDVIQALSDTGRITCDIMIQYLIEHNNTELSQEMFEFLHDHANRNSMKYSRYMKYNMIISNSMRLLNLNFVEGKSLSSSKQAIINIISSIVNGNSFIRAVSLKWLEINFYDLDWSKHTRLLRTFYRLCNKKIFNDIIKSEYNRQLIKAFDMDSLLEDMILYNEIDRFNILLDQDFHIEKLEKSFKCAIKYSKHKIIIALINHAIRLNVVKKSLKNLEKGSIPWKNIIEEISNIEKLEGLLNDQAFDHFTNQCELQLLLDSNLIKSFDDMGRIYPTKNFQRVEILLALKNEELKKQMISSFVNSLTEANVILYAKYKCKFIFNDDMYEQLKLLDRINVIDDSLIGIHHISKIFQVTKSMPYEYNKKLINLYIKLHNEIPLNDISVFELYNYTYLYTHDFNIKILPLDSDWILTYAITNASQKLLEFLKNAGYDFKKYVGFSFESYDEIYFDSYMARSAIYSYSMDIIQFLVANNMIKKLKWFLKLCGPIDDSIYEDKYHPFMYSRNIEMTQLLIYHGFNIDKMKNSTASDFSHPTENPNKIKEMKDNWNFICFNDLTLNKSSMDESHFKSSPSKFDLDENYSDFFLKLGNTGLDEMKINEFLACGMDI